MFFTRLLTLAAASFAPLLTATGANLVPNSSFECGSGRGWQMINAATSLKDDIVTGGYHGTRSLRLLTDRGGFSPPLWLTGGVTYTFSWYEKANESNSFRYEIWKTTAGGGGTGAWVITPTSWARRSVQYTPATTDYYQIGWWHFQPSMTAQVDAVQVEIGTTATPYAPQAPLEVALETSVERNTFFSGDPRQVQLRWWNDGSSTSASVYYEIFDLQNRKQATGFLTAALPSGASTSTLNLPINGWQRITTRIPTVDKSSDELTCVVLPFSAESGKAAAGILGTHTDTDVAQVSFLRKCGFTWTRSLSPASVFRWQVLEPTEDAYVWNDAGVTALAGGGMEVLGTLNGGLDFTGGPAWAHNADGSMKMDKWADFCTDVVHRYKGQVTHWEIWNEPQQSGTSWIQVAANYASMLTTACAAIKAEDPAARIIAMGGAFDEEWAWNVWNALSATTKGQIDFVACHLYPNDNSTDQNVAEYDPRHAEWRTRFAGTKPVWNTETGTWGHGGMLTGNAIWGYGYQTGSGWEAAEWQRAEASTRSKVSVDKITRNFLRSIGNGFAKYFYYDSRRWSQQAITATQPYSWEYTGSLRPTLAALCIANSFLDQYTSVTRPANTNAAAIESYVFEMGSSRVAAIFNNDRLCRDIAVSQTNFTVYDVMGNPVVQPNGKIRVTKTPQYIVSNGLTVAQMTALLQGGVTLVPDSTAPNISIDIAPSGTWTGGTAFLKWSGIDDTYVNSAAFQTNITFAWKLDDSPYSAFGQVTSARLSLAAGKHTLWVKAQDRDGNTAETSYVFAPSPVPPAPADLVVSPPQP